jgi:hydroxyethylthiazole kinase
MNTFGDFLDNVREKTPLVHNITNYVTVNDCANVLLACGASPIMADDTCDATEITTICNALNINIGTLNLRTIPGMLAAGKKAKECGHIVLLDPVGAGASSLRTKTAMDIIEEVKPDIIRGNVSEIKTLYFESGTTRGVDANVADKVSDENLSEMVEFAKKFCAKYSCVAAITGEIDIVCDSNRTYAIKNGNAMMSKVTGTGCMLSAISAAFAAANSDTLKAVVAAVVAMGLCGEKAFARLTAQDGNATYRNYVIDAVYNLKGKDLDYGARYEEF